MSQKKLLFVVNDMGALHPTKTTTQLARRAAARGPCLVAGCADLGATSGGALIAIARSMSEQGVLGPPEEVSLEEVGAVLVRTNPASDGAHWRQAHALDVLQLATERGIAVVNPPSALRVFSTKSGLLRLPEAAIPETALAASFGEVRRFVERVGRSVVKPVAGTHGEGVFMVEPGNPNLRAASEMLLQRGPVVVQNWLPEAKNGDVRLFLVDGEPLVVDGVVAAIRRIPAKGELRSNVHLGATPVLEPWTPALAQVAELVGPVLVERGVRVAGLDCIGDKVVEVNVCSPGGLTDMGAQGGVDFLEALLTAIA